MIAAPYDSRAMFMTTGSSRDIFTVHSAESDLGGDERRIRASTGSPIEGERQPLLPHGTTLGQSVSRPRGSSPRSTNPTSQSNVAPRGTRSHATERPLLKKVLIRHWESSHSGSNTLAEARRLASQENSSQSRLSSGAPAVDKTETDCCGSSCDECCSETCCFCLSVLCDL